MYHKFRLVFSFALLLATVVACQSTGTDSTEGVDSIAIGDAEADDAPVASTPASQGVSFKNSDGEIIALSDLKGKVVFINFWATWCPPCIAEIPSIQTLHDSLESEENIIFLLVDVDGELEQSNSFIHDRGYTLPNYIPASDIPTSFLDGAIPTTVVLDKEGNIAATQRGSADYSRPEASEFLRTLL